MSFLKESPIGLTETSFSAPVAKLALRFGVGAGMTCAAWVLFLQLTGNNAFGPKQILGLLVVPLAAAASQWLLRHTIAPVRPGVGRSLAVGGLTILLAAGIAASSVWSLAHAVGPTGLALTRAEMVDIVRVEQQQRAKEKRNPRLEQQEIQQAAALPINRLALGTFTWVLLLGMLVGVPSGVFLRK